MKQCWSEGELRAYIDRELPPEEMGRVAAHLEECSECGDLWAELAGRAARVSALMNELTETATVVAPVRVPVLARSRRRWAGAAMAIAAGLLIGIAVLPKRTLPAPAVSVPGPAMAASNTGGHPDVQAPAELPMVSLASDRPSRPAAKRSGARRPTPRKQGNEPFLALDDEPIEDGVVWRVELGPRQVPADVIIGSDGRPRAIRLVNSKPIR